MNILFINNQNRKLYSFVFLGLLMVVGVIIACLFLSNNSVGAIGQDLSWTLTSPEIFSSDTVDDLPNSACQHTPILREIAGTGEISLVCAFEGDAVSFGYSISNNAFRPLISFSNDTKMHRIYGICGIQHDSCVYLPGTDTLITKQYLINGIVRSLVIYKNFVSRLTKQVNVSNLAVEYMFDSSDPDYIFEDAHGYPWPIGGFGVSNDGKWLAVEFRQRGIGLLNIETMEMKRISSMIYYYDYGYNPTTEIAVSNGGRAVAVMGYNAGLYIYENTDSCGDLASDEKMWSVSPIVNICKTSPIKYIDFAYAGYPSFSDDGYELSFYKSSRTDGYRKLSLRVAGYENIKLEYLALGDSYSSGEGEFSDKYYLDGTNEKYEKCHVSSRSYPFLLADLSDLNLDLVKNVACSGATTGDVVGSDYSYLGQNERLGVDGLNMNNDEINLYQTKSKQTYHQGVVHQSSFSKIYQPKMITIGIGGNDIGMIDKLKTCIAPATCNWATDSDKKEQFAIEIKDLFEKLIDTYQNIHDISPNSKIYAVGYPIPADGDGPCDVLTGLLLDDSERKFMSEAVIYLNQIIKAAANKVGIGYFDIQESYGQQVMCGGEKPSGINSFVIGDDLGLSGESSLIKFIGNESFHPNPYGHQLAARYIFDSIGNVASYNYCPNQSTACPNYSIAPEPSVYWIQDGYHDYPELKLASFVLDRSTNASELQKRLLLPSYSLLPNSTVEVEINSTPISLGVFSTDNLGALDINIDLPENIEDGFHTVYIHGISYSGEKVDLYQVVKFQKMNLLEFGENTIVPDVNNTIYKLDHPKIDDTNTVDDNSEQIIEDLESIASENEFTVDNYPVGQIESRSNPVVLGDSTIPSVEESQIAISRNASKTYIFYALFISFVLLFIVIKIKRKE